MGQSPSRLLSRYPAFSSRDPRFIRQQFLERYGASEFRAPAPGETFRVSVNHAPLSDVALFYCEYHGDSHLEFPEAQFMRQLFHIEGLGYANIDGKALPVSDSAWSRIVPAQAAFELAAARKYRHLVFRINRRALQAMLDALLGNASDRQLLFDDQQDLNSPLMQSLRRRAHFFAAEINAIGPEISPIAIAEMERSIIAGFLLCNRHSFSGDFADPAAFAAPSSVKLVEDYIEANWASAIDIVALARIANTSARSLFRQFQAARGISPIAHLKRVRLRHAREMLQTGAEASVLAVALRCGFQNAGHFAQDYREKFGELPSSTLRHGKPRQRASRPAVA
jgi:AraC-like DNA-binding protein